MRRVARRLFMLCSVVSLLLWVASCVLWVRSYSASDHLFRSRRIQIPLTPEDRDWARGEGHEAEVTVLCRTVALTSLQGRVILMHRQETEGYSLQQVKSDRLNPLIGERSHYGWFSQSVRDDSAGRGRSRFGFHRQRVDQSQWNFIHTWEIPLFVPVVGFAILPLVWLSGRLSSRRAARRGRCPACGYDLRASPDRCPECGVSTPNATEAA
jgi:hypothetical protein